jgi:hypothetical protein
MKKYRSVSNMLLMRPLIHIKLEIDKSSGLGVKGGILIPEGSKVGAPADANPMTEFRVLSAGPDCKVVQDGDIVLANGYIAEKIPLGATKDSDGIVRIAETSIIGVVDEVPDEVAQTS